jgi:hypothetical protein
MSCNVAHKNQGTPLIDICVSSSLVVRVGANSCERRSGTPTRVREFLLVEADGAAIQSLGDPIAKMPVVPCVDYDASDGSVHHLGPWQGLLPVTPGP